MLRFAPGGQRLLLALDDGSIVAWDDVRGAGAGSVTPLVPAKDLEQVEDMDVRPDGRELAVAAGEKGLLRFELEPGSATTPARARLAGRALGGGAGDAIASVAYSADGARLALAGAKGTVRLVDTATGMTACETRPLRGEILRVAFSGRGLGRVAASSFDHLLRSWPLDNCQAEATRHVGHRSFVAGLGFTRGDSYLVSVSHDSSIRVWDPKQSGEEVYSRRIGLRSGPSRGPAFDFNGLAIAAAGAASTPAAARTLIATVGAEQGDGDAPAETLTLWDIGATRTATARPAAAATAPEDALEGIGDRLERARALQVEPRVLKDQVPGCR
jgi:WD40 repeat protein